MKRRRTSRGNRFVQKVVEICTWISLIMFFISVTMVDSESWIPTIVCIITIAWLGLVGYANTRED